MLNKELLNILVCPETKQDVKIAEDDIIEKLNEMIGRGGLRNRSHEKVTEKIDGGLVREDKKYLYPIRGDIPIMLIEEAIPLDE